MPEILSCCKNRQPKTCVLIAGEQSGDNHGAALIKALKELDPDFLFAGVGGPQMRPHLSASFADAEELHIMGFSKVIKELPRLIRLMNRLCKEILEKAPAVIITIDLPDFNIFLAKKLRRKGFKGLLVHYISPSVWAWRSGRIKTMAKTFDLLLTIFPFEPPFFEGSGLKTVYVGNPSLESSQESGLNKEPLIVIFPGSRASVIRANLPLQLEAARQTGLKIAISAASPNILPPLPRDIEIVSDCKELIQRASLAIATSGTITLELALAGIPTVATYKIGRLNYFLAYHLFRIRHNFYVMPNILLKRMLIPEIIGCYLESSQITAALQNVTKQKAHEGGEEIKNLLATHGRKPSLNAAKEILDALSLVH